MNRGYCSKCLGLDDKSCDCEHCNGTGKEKCICETLIPHPNEMWYCEKHGWMKASVNAGGGSSDSESKTLEKSEVCSTPTESMEQWEKEFSGIMLEWIKTQWKAESAHQAGEPYTRLKFEAEAAKVENKLKVFIRKVRQEAAIEERERIKRKLKYPTGHKIIDERIKKLFTES